MQPKNLMQSSRLLAEPLAALQHRMGMAAVARASGCTLASQLQQAQVLVHVLETLQILQQMQGSCR
jgi:hypothetical protein